MYHIVSMHHVCNVYNMSKQYNSHSEILFKPLKQLWKCEFSTLCKI